MLAGGFRGLHQLKLLTSICEAGGVTITWTITDLCSTTTTPATFSVVPPTPVTPADAQDLEVDACDYDNDVPGCGSG